MNLGLEFRFPDEEPREPPQNGELPDRAIAALLERPDGFEVFLREFTDAGLSDELATGQSSADQEDRLRDLLGAIELDGLHAQAAADIETITGESIEDILAAIIKVQITGEPDGVPSQIDRVLYGLRQTLLNDSSDPSSRSIEDLKHLSTDHRPSVDRGD